MRTFHLLILAYALMIIGCGYKGMPYWEDDTPKQTSQQESTQEQGSKQ